MTFISIVVPIYNDSYLVQDFCHEFSRIFSSYFKSDDLQNHLELIFIDDGSDRFSSDELIKVGSSYPYVKIIILSRNFGQHIALSCGYQEAKGDYVVMMNVDMQDPISEVPRLLEHLTTQNLDIVYGLRDLRQDPIMSRVSSRIFNIILNALTGSKTPLNVATLRVMNQRFIKAYNSISEKERYIPGLEDWLGFSKGYVKTVHNARTRGKSSYNLSRKVLMALNSVVSFSDLPLKFFSLIGMLISFIGFFMTTFLIVSKLFFIDYRPGYTSTISVIILLGGLQVFVIGLSGIYIGRILKEVQNRPLFIIKERINC